GSVKPRVGPTSQPVIPLQNELSSIGPVRSVPVLLKTSSPPFTACTYSVSPTSPTVSGGTYCVVRADMRRPSKLPAVAGTLTLPTAAWTAASWTAGTTVALDCRSSSGGAGGASV